MAHLILRNYTAGKKDSNQIKSIQIINQKEKEKKRKKEYRMKKDEAFVNLWIITWKVYAHDSRLLIC